MSQMPIFIFIYYNLFFFYIVNYDLCFILDETLSFAIETGKNTHYFLR
jgi:hypothetical protein